MTYKEMAEELQAVLENSMPIGEISSGKAYIEQEKELFKYCRDTISKTPFGAHLFLEEDPKTGMSYKLHGTAAGYCVDIGYIAKAYDVCTGKDHIEVCFYCVDQYGQEEHEKAILLMAKKECENSIHWNSLSLKKKKLEVYHLEKKIAEEEKYLEDIGRLLSE